MTSTCIASLAVVSMALTMGSAHAAQVTPVAGEVLVNVGAGYRSIAGVVDVEPGGSVIAGASAQASLAYPDGCVVDIVPGMVAWVEATSPCANQSVQTRDPGVTLSAPRVFDPTWLLNGAALIDRKKRPAGP